jgi:peroxiredoxin Q/BCP
LKAYQADIAKFDAADTQILGLSVDSFAANKRFAEDLGVTFPLLSDFHRKVSKAYGILDEERGFATRATFVVDEEGIIRHIEQGGSAIDPSGAYQACNVLAGKK